MEANHQQQDLTTCARMLQEQLNSQSFWPFSYPYGKSSSFNSFTVETVQQLGFGCAFATEVGNNQVGQDLFSIRRVDTKDVHPSA